MERANNNNANPAIMTTIPTPSAQPAITNTIKLSTQCDVNVIESLKKYNQSQIEKVLCIENDTSTLDGDVVGEAAAVHDNDDMPERSEPAAIAKTVVCLLLVFMTVYLLCTLFSMSLLCHLDFISTFLCVSLTHSHSRSLYGPKFFFEFA